MKFGKQIQAQQVPGWSPYYLDYKFLKKIISSLAANRPASEAAALASGIRPSDILNQPSTNVLFTPDTRSPALASNQSPGRPPIFTASDYDKDRGPDFRAHKAAFFFKLERELEKVNNFYLQQEAELKMRLETLLSKRRAAAMRGLPDPNDGSMAKNHVEWSAVEEGFRLLERDLGKLQQFIEINATGFRKILKKFDKRSTLTTKELYLSRQVDVQPIFNRQLISELADTVASCLMDLTNLSAGLKFENPTTNDIFTQEILQERLPPSGPLRDFESNLHNAVAVADRGAVTDCVRYSEVLAQQNGNNTDVARILWSVIIEAPPDMADLILASLSNPFDFQFVDDINGRTCLHEAAIAGVLHLVNLCIDNGVQVDRTDVYGRTPLHYASMHGHAVVCRRLLEAGVPPDTLDRDNYTPLVYATIKGCVDCVRVLLEEGKVSIQPGSPAYDLQPLSMASQSGYVQIVILLLQYGAQCLPNANGEYPMHLAAREGHVETCRLLLGKDGWDMPDKYYEWTPLFHSARYGHRDCVRVLLEAGARVLAMDEIEHMAAHYAGWYGHSACLDLLLDAESKLPFNMNSGELQKSPLLDDGYRQTSELDMIPLLSLPPPIMPHRVYGHNYLDKSHLVRIIIGPSSLQKRPLGYSGVRLRHRLLVSAFNNDCFPSSAPLRLVMTTGDEANPAPYTVLVPQKNGKEVFTFQIADLERLSLEFSVYPSFGSKTIGRGVALPSLFADVHNTASFTLPLLDNRLNVVGEVGFDICIIKAFNGVTLAIGGDFETYWKSMAMPIMSPLQTAPPRPIHRSTLIGSAHASPSTQSDTGIGGQTVTISSLEGQYVNITVQITKDLQPVIFSNWLLPQTDFDLCVSDVTLAQFESLASRLGRGSEYLVGSPEAWPSLLPQAMISLAQFYNILPQGIGISVDLAYPVLGSHASRNQPDLNDFVDAVLRTIYQVSTPSEDLTKRRSVIFMSFSPDVSAFLNWKQPNYPVFYASLCGKENGVAIGLSTNDDDDDDRASSLGAAVEFAKSNNLLGVFVDADLLVKVPSLIQGIRNAGLLVGVHGKADDCVKLITASQIDGTPVDAYITEGMVVFVDHGMKESI
ncbi:hypothetical protein AX17_000891 [Amanita inopinata Kibby_2008]|nr:hypothetical protein AX17_000891 [Amanita inopinata Kibby_2008]